MFFFEHFFGVIFLIIFLNIFLNIFWGQGLGIFFVYRMFEKNFRGGG